MTTEREDLPEGEPVELDASVFAEVLAHEAETSRRMGVESHMVITDTDDQEHGIELTEGVEKVESQGHHVLIWMRNAGIVTVSGAAVVAAVAFIRHRMKKP